MIHCPPGVCQNPGSQAPIAVNLAMRTYYAFYDHLLVSLNLAKMLQAVSQVPTAQIPIKNPFAKYSTIEVQFSRPKLLRIPKGIASKCAIFLLKPNFSRDSTIA